MSVAVHERHRIGIGAPIAGEGALEIAAQLFAPAQPRLEQVFFCLPGGSLNGDYFNLQPDDGDTSFSFAQQMAARGFITVTMDRAATVTMLAALVNALDKVNSLPLGSTLLSGSMPA